MSAGLRLAISLLQDINKTLSPVYLDGVRYEIQDAPISYPATLEIATTPIILVFIEDITPTWLDKSEGFNARITCYLGSTSEGIFDDTLQAGLLFEQNLIELYGNMLNANGGFYVLDNSDGYKITITGGDAIASGIRSDFQYTKEDVFYWGFSLTLPMELEWDTNC